jgi:hypothetical protein
MSASINLDPAAKLDIDVPENHSYIIAFKIKDKATQSYRQFTGTWKMVVAADVDGIKIVKTFTVGDGLTLSSDLLTLTLDIPTVQNSIKPGKYFYDLRGDEGGYSKHPIYGRFNANYVIAKQ